jgi:hypothetical protein
MVRVCASIAFSPVASANLFALPWFYVKGPSFSSQRRDLEQK